MSYSIISFNLRNIYASAMDRDWRAVAEILRTERADIVAVQEVFSEFPIKHLCRQMNVDKGALCPIGGIVWFHARRAEMVAEKDKPFFGMHGV